MINNDLIAVYTAIRIILEIKRQCGLEAMLEYLEKYCLKLEAGTKLHDIVDMALKNVDILKVYNEIRKEG